MHPSNGRAVVLGVLPNAQIDVLSFALFFRFFVDQSCRACFNYSTVYLILFG
jgi:hypothetical protein